MLVNLAIVFIIAMIFVLIFEKMRLPGLLGMILTGVLLGPYTRNWVSNFMNLDILKNVFISDKLIDMSGELRTAALIVILIRAGLGINKKTLNKIGISAVKMSCIPGILEGITLITVLHYFVGMPVIEAGLLAFVLAAVSPAVIVPQMLELKEKGYGKKKEVPTLVLAGASIDDVFAITIFGAFLGMLSTSAVRNNLLLDIINIPISIGLGILGGVILGYVFVKICKEYHMRDTKKVMLFMIIAILFHHIEEIKIIPLASLLGIMAMGFVILEKYEVLAKRLAAKFNKVWVLAEIVLFVMIGAAVNVSVIFQSGLLGIVIIILGLVGRSIGVWLSLLGSELNKKEKIFCILAYLPKATVQAAIGGVALSMVTKGQIALSNGINTGEYILAMAVLSIVFTAPLGAIAVKIGAPKLLGIEE
ncbi:MAG: potassium transporter [Fusobacteriia bacterium 4572_132]|nr:MAG: potassium transporter [Fusobacteriia bacterium 4572_132]